MNIGNSDDSSVGTSVHDWKRECYETMGVDAFVAAQLLCSVRQSISWEFQPGAQRSDKPQDG